MQLHLTGMLGMDEYNEEIIEQVRTLMRDCGAEAYVRQKAEEFTKQAQGILKQFPDNEYRSHLLELSSFLVNRDQ